MVLTTKEVGRRRTISQLRDLMKDKYHEFDEQGNRHKNWKNIALEALKVTIKIDRG